MRSPYAAPRQEDAVRTYLAQRITELTAELAEARADVDRLRQANAEMVRARAGLKATPRWRRWQV